MQTPWQLHLIALIVVCGTLATETFYLFAGIKSVIPEVLIGRILGTMDSALMIVLGYYFAASIMQGRGSQRASDPTPPPPTPTDPKGPPA